MSAFTVRTLEVLYWSVEMVWLLLFCTLILKADPFTGVIPSENLLDVRETVLPGVVVIRLNFPRAEEV